ncbi:Gfo/Idh/MocA family protein [Paenibacillus sp. N3.4]|uniref:Gfo/Idh/MocA family protein n=1 Tax=Paenibacillus sp. N3.4 TaxID=2603222 RepID=UPI0011C7CC6F|nr:Gfo/Idh/MocA family oxidoreductase [Paenibacillus sp. N3.4]TXK76943.1 Gfo/Idh/MocA family oxidoreductase [Paenibacillus sp. N3.4]
MSKYRVVIVGCGGMANVWVEYIINREDAVIVACVDIKLEFAQAMADRHSLNCGIYTNVELAIQESDANLVLDITIPSSHFEVCTTALRNGCNVFGEKPMAATMDEAIKIVQLAEQTNTSLSVMQNRRYDANIRAMKDLIQGGTIGRVGYVGADFFLGPHFGGFRDAMESPLILDMAIHTFDQARFLTGADPISVYCQEFNPPGSWYAGNASAICIYEMSDGSVFCYRGSWCAEGASTSWEAAWRVTGEQGTAIWDSSGTPYAEVVSPGDQSGKFLRDFTRVDADVNWPGRSGHAGCLDEMFDALEQGRYAETDCRDNIKSMAMVLGALESAKLAQKIDLRQYWN